MLSVFAVPAFAEEMKTAEDYLAEAAQLYSEGKYEDAGTAYINAGNILVASRNYDSAIDTYMKSVACSMKLDDWNCAAIAYDMAAQTYKALGDVKSAFSTYMKAGSCYMKEDMFDKANETFSDAFYAYKNYDRSIECDNQQTETDSVNEIDFENTDMAIYLLEDYYKAMALVGKTNATWKAGNVGAANKALDAINDVFNWGYCNGPSFNDEVIETNIFFGSTLSEGNLTIIVGVACSVVFLAVGFFIGTKKKKKPALADGAETTDEE